MNSSKRPTKFQEAYPVGDAPFCHIQRLLFLDLNFTYDDPYEGFRRSSIKGIIGTLFKVKQPDVVTALEVAGGAKLKHLVVDTVRTANAILKHGNLKRKTTIIPLDKIRPDVMSSAIRERAQQMFGDNAASAMDFIEYHQEMEGVMHYIFGRVFICKAQAV